MERQISTDGIPVIARGGQAKIYAYGEGKVLRAANRRQDFDRIRYEYEVYAALAESRVPAPAVYELVDADGAPAIVMERLEGTSMMDVMRKNPFTAGHLARELARLHLGLADTVITGKLSGILTGTKKKAEYCIVKSAALSAAEKNRILGLLRELPDGNGLCHGDFHPGNLIRSADGYCIIDWSAATTGDIHADIAHSHILMRTAPRVPGMNPLLYFLQKRMGRSFAGDYLSEIVRIREIDFTLLSRWTLINAAERTFHGLPSEQKTLRDYIALYLKALQAGTEEKQLYKRI